jgi:putrescine importer
MAAAAEKQPNREPSASIARSALWNLIIIGMVIIQPTAPMGIYGVISNKAHGHVVTTILLAMIAMLFTAISYGRMARVYPSAGSAYTYVGQEIHSALGYVVGWGMVMDYLINPLICTAFCAKAAMNILPGLSFLRLDDLLRGLLHLDEPARHQDLGAVE